MPTYEYECTKCGNLFEKFQPITSKPVSTCPKCRGKVKRLISGGSGLIFKGSGFYITENRSASYKEKAKSEGGASPGKEGGGSSGGESSKPGKDGGKGGKPAGEGAAKKEKGGSGAKD